MKQAKRPAVSAVATGYRRRVLVADILRTVAAELQIDRPAVLRSCDQHREIVGARQVAIWLTHQLTSMSLSKIGREFRRHHTTVLYSIAMVDRHRISDPDVRALTDGLLARLNGEGQRKLPLTTGER